MSATWYRVAQALSERVPSPQALHLARWAADAQWHRAAAARRAVGDNLGVLTNEAVSDRSPLVREVFQNFGAYLVEFFSAHRHSLRTITVEGTEEVVRRLHEHRNGIILSAHVGNWELGGIALAWLGCRLGVVALPHPQQTVNRLFDAQRRRCGIEVIPLDTHAAGRSLHVLRQGRWLALLGDREFGTSGVPSTLCGRSVRVPGGPAILSIRSGCPIVPLFLIRRGPWHFRFHLEETIWPSGDGAMHQRILDVTRRCSESIDVTLQRYPTQWLMFQPFFGEPADPAAMTLSMAAR